MKFYGDVYIEPVAQLKKNEPTQNQIQLTPQSKAIYSTLLEKTDYQ